METLIQILLLWAIAAINFIAVMIIVKIIEWFKGNRK